MFTHTHTHTLALTHTYTHTHTHTHTHAHTHTHTHIAALEQLNSQIGSPFHRGGGGGLPQKNGPLSSSIGSVATLTTVADEECDEPENLGRVGGWVASFDKLLADPLGVQCLLVSVCV